MRRSLQAVFIAAAATTAAACGATRASNAGPDTSRSFPVGDFSSIEVSGPYDVRVRTGGKPGVSVKGPQNIVADMVVEVDGNALKIRPKKNGLFRGMQWGKHSPVTVEVSAAMLEGAAIAGSGDLSVDRVKGSAFRGAVAGSGSLSIGAVEVDKLKLDIAGSGDIDAAGKAKEAEYKIAGSGDVNSSKVISQTLRVAIAGSGDVAAQATDTANIKIMGSGDVTVTGGAECEVSKMGSGSANCS